MAAEEILKLFDTIWFEQGIFSVTAQEKQQEIDQESISVDTSSSSSPVEDSPTSVIITRKKVAGSVKMRDKKKKCCSRWSCSAFNDIKESTSIARRRDGKPKGGVKGIGIRRSSSELELEELKGFMDLGFEFSEEDKDSRLVTIIPGLVKLGKGERKEVENGVKEDVISRPYLSEAWEILEKRKMRRKLLKWRFPALHNEMKMKDNLRIWAQTVASSF